MVAQYYPRQPEGSRADIRAKGVWREGRWTIEWARKLQTGHDDDVAFVPGQSYDFVVSCYEMAASEVHPEWSQPLYKAGDAFDLLRLRIATGDERVAGRER